MYLNGGVITTVQNLLRYIEYSFLGCIPVYKITIKLASKLYSDKVQISAEIMLSGFYSIFFFFFFFFFTEFTGMVKGYK